jgi:ADP-ribose pyrophosphatase YjhB (NUDIX family)
MKIDMLGSRISIRKSDIRNAKADAVVKDVSVKPDENNIRIFYANMLNKASKRGARSIAFSPIGCKAGFPMLASAKIAAQEVLKHLRGKGPALKDISFCVKGDKEAAIFNKGVIGYLRHFTEDLSDRPFTTVDAIIEVKGGIVVIERPNPPFGFALPGGFVDCGESLEEAVAREAKEETGLKLYNVRQFHTYSDPKRDPRFHTIGTVFIAKAKGRPKAGDDAAALRVVKLRDISKMKFAFDHAKILKDYLAYKQDHDPF